MIAGGADEISAGDFDGNHLQRAAQKDVIDAADRVMAEPCSHRSMIAVELQLCISKLGDQLAIGGRAGKRVEVAAENQRLMAIGVAEPLIAEQCVDLREALAV